MQKVIQVFLIFITLVNPIFSDDIESILDQSTEPAPKSKILGNDIMSLIKNQKFKEAESALHRLKKQNSLVDFYYLTACLLYQQKKYVTAQKNLLEATRLNPNHDPSYFLAGLIHLNSYNTASAIENFKSAVSLADYNPFYRFNYSVALFINEEYIKSIAEAEKTVELKQNFHQAEILIIKNLIALKNYEKALENAVHLIKKYPENEEHLTIYARTLFLNRKNFSEIVTILKKLKKKTVEDKRILALSLYEEKDFAESMQLLVHTMQNGFEFEEDLSISMKNSILLGNQQDAREYLSKLIQKYPEKEDRFLSMYHKTLDEYWAYSNSYKKILWR